MTRGQATSWGTFDGQIWGVSIVKAGVVQDSFPFSEGAGSTAYDSSGNGNHGTITNATLSSFWGTTQDEYAGNFKNGHTKYTHASLDDLRVPYGNDGSPLSITIPTGYTKEADHPPLPTHNDFEGVLDYKNIGVGDVVIPETAHLVSAIETIEFEETVANPVYKKEGAWLRYYDATLDTDDNTQVTNCAS